MKTLIQKKKALEKESTKPEVYEAKGKLELDLNFSLPIKYTTVKSNKYNSKS